jgi:hypothetical protein
MPPKQFQLLSRCVMLDIILFVESFIAKVPSGGADGDIIKLFGGEWKAVWLKRLGEEFDGWTAEGADQVIRFMDRGLGPSCKSTGTNYMRLTYLEYILPKYMRGMANRGMLDHLSRQSDENWVRVAREATQLRRGRAPRP